MNYIWCFMIVASYIFALFTGNVPNVNSAVFSGCESAVNLVISLIGMMCFWSGLLEIAERSGLVKKVQKLLNPIISWLFPTIKEDTKTLSAIAMSISANLLGLSNAATPLGLSAMEKLEKRNPVKSTASDEMCMFVVINTASLTLVPTTLLTIRNSFASVYPFEILVPVWIVSIITLFAGVLTAKAFSRKKI